MAELAPGTADKPSSTTDTGGPLIARQELGTSFPGVCMVCGEDLQPEPTRRGPKRLYHPACGVVVKHLAATQRALLALGTLPADHAAAMRRRLLATANMLPTRWERPRDVRGRFTADD